MSRPTLEEIRGRVAGHLDNIKDLEQQIKHECLSIQHLQLDCPHPHKRYDNAREHGPRSSYCPNCRKQW